MGWVLANTLNVFVTGTDLLTGHLRAWIPQWKAQARTAAQEIGSSLKGAFQVPTANLPKPGSQSGSLLFDILGGNLLANLITGAVSGAVGMATQQVARIQSGLLEASRLETSTIASASQLSTSLGINIEAAKKLTKDLRMEVVDIADQYIGDTSTYTAAFEQIAPIVGELFRGNETGFREAILDITKRTGAIGATKGISGVESGNTISRLLMGTMGVGEAMQLDLLQKTPLGKALYDSIAKYGISNDDWKKLSTQARFQIINDALRRVATDDMLAQFEDTTEGYLEVLKTRLFNPDVGIFGFMRGIEQANGRSVLDSFRGALGNIVKLWDTLAEVFKNTGIDVDPLLGLVRFFDWINDIAVSINRVFGERKKLVGDQDNSLGDLVSQWLATLPARIGDAIGWLINKAMEGIAYLVPKVNNAIGDIDWGKVGDFGKKMIENLAPWVSKVFRGLGDMFASVDWGAVGQSLMMAVWTAIDLLAVAIVNVPWGDVIYALFRATTGLKDLLWGAIVGLFQGLAEHFLGFLRWLTGAKDNTQLALQRFTDALMSLLDSLLFWLPAPLRPSSTVQTLTGQEKETKLTGISSLDNKAMEGLGIVGRWLGFDTGQDQGIQTAPLTVPNVNNRTNSSIFSPQITVNTQATDAQGTADEVMGKLSKSYEEYKANVLTR